MGKVVDLAAFRARRARVRGGVKSRPPDDLGDDEIRVRYRPDGSYHVSISGIYAESRPLAVEALADIIQRLAIAAKRAGEPA